VSPPSQLSQTALAGVEALWSAYETATGDERPAPDTLAHADLKPEHVLHDPTSGEITAVLDWGDACLSQATFDLAIVGLFFDASVRAELACRLPDVDGRQVVRDAGLLVAVRWLCDLELGAADGDEPFQDICAAELRAHLQVALRRED
jgi:aminoglycoside phosphotransferase (APT) family kinase protein